MESYTYILAPNTANNFAVLQIALQEFPVIVENKQLKIAYKKSSLDVVSEDDSLLVPAVADTFIYMKAKTADISEALLSQVQGYQLFNIDTQPFTDFWL